MFIYDRHHGDGRAAEMALEIQGSGREDQTDSGHWRERWDPHCGRRFFSFLLLSLRSQFELPVKHHRWRRGPLMVLNPLLSAPHVLFHDSPFSVSFVSVVFIERYFVSFSFPSVSLNSLSLPLTL